MPSCSNPGERRGGRHKGTPKKVSADLKNMILTALSEEGCPAIRPIVVHHNLTPQGSVRNLCIASLSGLRPGPVRQRASGYVAVDLAF